MIKFFDLNFDFKVLKVVVEVGYEMFIFIQVGVIFVVLEGWDVLGIVQIGIGKIVSFILLMIIFLWCGCVWVCMLCSFVLCLIWELVVQVVENFDVYVKNIKLIKVLLIGGVLFKE